MDWRIKALMQSAFTMIPGGVGLYLKLQHRGGTLLAFEQQCENRIGDFRNMVGYLKPAGFSIADRAFFEVGTGWYPTSPLCLYLAGARSVVTTDAYRFMQMDLTRRCVKQLGRHLPLMAEAGGRSLDEVTARYRALDSALDGGADLETATKGAIVYRAPAVTGRSGLPDASIDIVFSNGTLEHIPKNELIAFYADSYRILTRDGGMIHNVTPADFYSHFDPSITQFNYLRYSESAWKKWNNKLHYQNRLRAVDFTRMAESAGFRVELNTGQVTERNREDLRRVPLAAEFRGYTEDELSVAYFTFLARKT